MKKIININLSGRVIPIEDSAYEKLQAYIESLRRYFANEEGRDEIINDIESRIAELMNEKIRMGAAAIADDDVNGIIKSMGTTEDFEAEEKENASTGTSSSFQQEQQQSGYTYTKAKRGRLYRDANDKIIGGVCSGIANYMEIDPAVIRFLFGIVTLGGFGLGIFVYILMWIILPAKDLEDYSGKRLYRNPDDKVIGGVSGGLAAYFNMRSSTVRLIFLAPVVLNILISALNGFHWHYGLNIGFGSLTGMFIITYIILWIVLPEATSDYQKMEMRGETVDVNRIRQNVQEGMQNIKTKLKDWGKEVKGSAQNIGSRGKAFASEAGDAVRRNRRGVGHVIGVIFKAFFLFIIGSIAFGLFVAFIALIFGGVAWWPVNDFLWTSRGQQLYAWGTLLFFVGIPLIAFIVWVVRRILRVRSRGNYLGWTFGGLWLIGWVCAVLFASSISRDFRSYEHSDMNISVTQPVNKKMIVAVSQPELEFTGNFMWMGHENTGWDLSSDTLKLSTVRMNVVASPDSVYHAIVKRFSYGNSEEDAMDRAKDIQYSVVSRDSILDLGSGYTVSKGKKFRFQQVEVEIQVPVGKKIRFDESVENKLNPVNFRIKRRFRNSRHITFEIDDESRYFRFRTGIDYTMDAGGNLVAPGESLKPQNNQNNNDYRYNNNNNDTINIDKQIEQREKEIQELKDKKKGQQTKSTTINSKPKNEDENSVVRSSGPGLSLVQFF